MRLCFSIRISTMLLKHTLLMYGNASSLGINVHHRFARSRDQVGNRPECCKVWQAFEESFEKDCRYRSFWSPAGQCLARPSTPSARSKDPTSLDELPIPPFTDWRFQQDPASHKFSPLGDHPQKQL